jgi:hypothetical protein
MNIFPKPVLQRDGIFGYPEEVGLCIGKLMLGFP